MSPWLIAYIASAVFAGSSSAIALSHGCKEANPLAPQRPIYNMAFKAGTTAGITVGLHFVIGKSPKIGKTLTLIGVGVNVADGLHDATVNCHGTR